MGIVRLHLGCAVILANPLISFLGISIRVVDTTTVRRMRSEEKIKPCRFHTYQQVDKNGVYSVEEKKVIEETPFAKLMESFRVFTWKCVRCGHEKKRKAFSATWWVLNDKGEK